jgi:hypothetical protein
MGQPYRDQLGIDPAFSVQKTGDRREVRKGQDADIEAYDVLDTAGQCVAKYEIVDSTSTYPPFDRTVSYRRTDQPSDAGPLRPI